MTIAINHGVRINKPRIIATIATAIIIPPIVILGLRIDRSPYGASSTSVQSPHLEDRRGNRQSIQMTEIPLEAIMQSSRAGKSHLLIGPLAIYTARGRSGH
jgi:hypothetical protein